jgi:hypothetical protein
MFKQILENKWFKRASKATLIVVLLDFIAGLAILAIGYLGFM